MSRADFFAEEAERLLAMSERKAAKQIAALSNRHARTLPALIAAMRERAGNQRVTRLLTLADEIAVADRPPVRIRTVPPGGPDEGTVLNVDELVEALRLPLEDLAAAIFEPAGGGWYRLTGGMQ
jgi:hypothetical protein